MALAAGLLIVVGVAIMVGPALPRQALARLRGSRPPRPHRRRRKPPVSIPADPPLNPTTQKAIVVAARLATLLRAQGRDSHGADLKRAVQRLRADEPAGLYALQAAIRNLRYLSLDEPEADRQLQRLVTELRRTVRDRAEQLELLPFG